MVNGPLWAVREALRQLGWRIHSGGSALEVSVTGEIIRLNLTSPKEVARLAWEGWQDTLFRKVVQDLGPRRQLMGEADQQEWCHQLVRDLVATKTFDGRARAVAVQVLAGTVPTGSWLNAHGWCTEGKCGCGEADTVTHRLTGCSVRAGCPVQGIRAYKDLWALLVAPPVPEKMHPQGFVLQAQDPVGSAWRLESGEGYTDGSVRWPRWLCLASGGMALVQLDSEGRPVRWHAATLAQGCRQVAINTEMLALAAAAVHAPPNGILIIWADCQAVVSGFAQLETVADDHKNLYAGIWRIVRSALEENGCKM